MNPLISFCLPIYNVRAWLKYCLDFIMTYDELYEIICVDDCFNIYKVYSKKHLNVKSFRNNEGNTNE